MFVAIEGMDGVGKTTISKRLAEYFGMEYIEKPMQKFLNISDNDYNDLCIKVWTSKNPNTTAWFFSLGNIVSRYFSEDVIVDRHILSTYYWDSVNTDEKVFELMATGEVIPDITFILYSGIETRINRMKARNKNDSDLKESRTLEFGYDKMIDFAKRVNMPFILINTEDKNEEEVFSIIVEILNTIINLPKDKLYEICDNYNGEFEKNNSEVMESVKKIVRRKRNEKNIN